MVINYCILALLSLTCLLPFVHLLAVSFSSSAAVSAGEVGFWPVDFTLFSYEFALKGGKFFAALLVSLERVVLGVCINLALMIVTAYPLSKAKEKVAGRNIYMAFFVITMLINGGLIPTYLVVVKLGLKNSIWSLILPGALPVYNMIILMNFMRGLPEEIEEAAMIDGAGPFRILFRIVLPVLKPALATVGLFSIVGHWNDWFSGLIYMNKPADYPLQTYLQTLLASFEQLMQKSGTDYTKLLSMMNARTGRAAQLFLGAIPIMLIYPFLQKYFTKGLVIGSVKG
ncbi:carbohydrate ABC transporter permease [Parasutterella excrementihominis]|uniref:carbohydrate ABC transporter permease n=1 Tax=Parasutterella excrementihominis TaxID=487175 RepID=UPI00272DDF0F|nr:carbohydrate ABC transporter permease [Parasutterella excrementihominis]